MDKITKYKSFIKKAIKRHYHPSDSDYTEFERQLVFDDKRGHYFLIDVGWDNHKRIFECHLHIDLKDGKIWIRQDWTEGVVDDFLEMGVPKEDIVLAFQAPYKRPYTEFSVA